MELELSPRGAKSNNGNLSKPYQLEIHPHNLSAFLVRVLSVGQPVSKMLRPMTSNGLGCEFIASSSEKAYAVQGPEFPIPWPSDFPEELNVSSFDCA